MSKKTDEEPKKNWFNSNDTYKQLSDDMSSIGKKLEDLKNKTQKETSETLSKLGLDLTKFNATTQIGIRRAKNSVAELGKNLTKLKENAPNLSEAELKAKVKEFNDSIKKNSQRSLENLDKWYKNAADKIKKGNTDLEAEANRLATSFEQSVSAFKDKIQNTTTKVEVTAKTTIETLNTNVIDIRDEIAKVSGKVSEQEKVKLRKLFSTIESCFSELEYDLDQNTIDLSSADRKVFKKLGDDIKKMESTLSRVKGDVPANFKSEVIPLFDRAKKECSTIKKGIQKIS